MRTITLINYDAVVDGKEPLCLGTFLSYGVEQLSIVPGDGWDGLTITATFSQGGKVLAEPVLVTETGVINVPAGATAKTITLGKPGVIVFRGVADGVQRISTNVPYVVGNHGPVDGSTPPPDPSAWEQYVKQLTDVVRREIPDDGLPGQVLTKSESGNMWAYPSGGGGGGGSYIIGDGLKYDPGSNILSVDTTDVPEQDNTKPITSAGVYTTLGNIDVLLGTI